MSGYIKVSFGVFKTRDGMIIKEVRSMKNDTDMSWTYLCGEDVPEITIEKHPVEEGKFHLRLNPLSTITLDRITLLELALKFMKMAEELYGEDQ